MTTLDTTEIKSKPRISVAPMMDWTTRQNNPLIYSNLK